VSGNDPKSMSDRLGTVTNVLVILVAIGFLMSPGGPVLRKIAEWRDAAERERLAETHWLKLVEDAPVLGPSGSDVQVVEFIDYQCPFCQRMHNDLQRSSSEQELRIGIRHLPLRSIHPNAELAARISICAEGEPDRWLTVHNFLFEVADTLDRIEWASALESKGVRGGKEIERCVGANGADERLARDEALAEALRIRATPTYVFPDGIEGGLPEEELRRRVR
jgi:protein-disulfide isomerase